MGLFRKNHAPDPISERARTLNAQIAALEKQIDELSSQANHEPQPRLRSTALPHSQAVTPSTSPRIHFNDPVFEEPANHALKSDGESLLTPAHYNDLGVRKYDLLGSWRRMTNHFRGPSASNPKLINYLAAGSIQGLRPLRYEKRVARNRLILMVVVLIVVLTGIFAVYFRRN